jgi:quercetin dioxygenase-like cupin family protein
MKMNPLRNKPVLLVGLGALALFSIVAYAASSTILGVGTNAHSEIINGPATMTARRLTIPAGEVGGWHYHPGLITAVVTRGTVTIEDGCGGAETFTAGQAFEKNDGRVHRAINPGTEEEEEYNMFIVPQGNPITVNIPNNQRLCGPPRVKDECKNTGWMNFNYPQAFNNQGECVSFVAARQ